MNSLEQHYIHVVQKDLILSENASAVSKLPGPYTIVINLGGGSSEDCVISSLAALYLITGEKPEISHQNRKFTDEVVEAKATLRGFAMYSFFYQLLQNVFPRIRQLELRPILHENEYTFLLEDIFSFEDLLFLYPYFEELRYLQCRFKFKSGVVGTATVLGNGMQFPF